MRIIWEFFLEEIWNRFEELIQGRVKIRPTWPSLTKWAKVNILLKLIKNNVFKMCLEWFTID